MGFVVSELEEKGLFRFFPPLLIFYDVGFPCLFGWREMKRMKFWILNFFVVWELWEMHAAERIRAQVWDFQF